MDVSIDEVNQTATITSDKYINKFLIKKAPGGFIFFKVELESGTLVPKDISGLYSSIPKAIASVTQFLKTAKETQHAKNERLDKERKERKNGAVSNSKGS